MNLYDETKQIMKKYSIFAKKSLGQNFLIDEEVINAIIDSAEVSTEDLIIEIGPGLGTLTKRLLEKAGKVICIELDIKMINILQDRFKGVSNFELINDDVLQVDLKDIINKNSEYKKVKVVANLPYYITTPIIMKLLESKLNVDTITIMIQKEVADRLVTIPGTGDTGAITYAIHYYTKPKIVLQVPNTSFIPAPEVNSTVIQLKVNEKPGVNVLDEEIFFKVIKIAFMQKRKTLLNALSNGLNNMSKANVEEMLNKLGIETSIRAENLSIEQFRDIANYLTNYGF